MQSQSDLSTSLTKNTTGYNYKLCTRGFILAIVLMKHRHMFVVLVPSVEHFVTDAAIVLEAVGEVDGLDVILCVVLGAMPECVANGAEPG
jgi:hypothetical protein